MDDFVGALGYSFGLFPLFLMVLGTLLGILVGAIPGLTGAMLIALTLPLTFYMAPRDALILLISMYTGAISGGLITATLLRMPGTPASVMTTFDGYPMARAGQPGRALGYGIAASFIGGLVAWVALVTLAKPLSVWATRFGPFEYFSLVLMALVLIASVSQGSLTKGLLSGVLGMLVAMPGVDPASGTIRLTFGTHHLVNGLEVLPVLVGVFAVGTLLSDIVSINNKPQILGMSSRGIFMKLSEWRANFVNMLRSSLIGTWIGILPGIGANIGSVVAYSVAKNFSRRPEKFGKGSEEGIIASEAANNATVGGALVPLIAMGIPGSVIDVFLIGAMMIHSIQPGPLLFENSPDIVWVMIVACLLSNIAMFGIMLLGVRPISKLMFLPRQVLLPIIMVFCVLGVYASSNLFFDIWVMLAFGVIGFFLERAKIPLGPFVIGYILAPIAETKFRSGLMMTGGEIWPMFTRPLSATFIGISVLLLVWSFYNEWRGRKLNDALLGTTTPAK